MRTATPPASVTSLPINFTSFVVAIVIFVAFVKMSPNLPVYICIAAMLLSIVVVIVALELMTRRLVIKKQNCFSWRRLAIKLFAFYTCMALIAFIYSVFPEYHRHFYYNYFVVVNHILPFLLIAAVPYFIVTDLCMDDPKDSYWSFGSWLLRLHDIRLNRQHYNLLLGWLVKLFFAPLMLIFLSQDVKLLSHFSLAQFSSDHIYLFKICMTFLYFTDVMYALTGYVSSLRLFNTQINTVEPTFFGWFIAISCYPPFITLLFGAYFNYSAARMLNSWIINHAMTLDVLGVLTICFLTLYAISTICFSMRFSNLTHRGIITNGPYRHTKHPAYIYKNITWWLTTMPIIFSHGFGVAIQSCLLLLLVNLVYFLRAKTEERHLSWDPTYIAYAAYIERYGLFSILGKWFPVLKFKPGKLLNLSSSNSQ